MPARRMPSSVNGATGSSRPKPNMMTRQITLCRTYDADTGRDPALAVVINFYPEICGKESAPGT